MKQQILHDPVSFERKAVTWKMCCHYKGLQYHKIDCNGFAGVFQRALDILGGSSNYIDTEYHLPLPEIPEENLYLFEAASTADVFGAMGSWNDSPRYMAHEKGMDKEYEFLSDELLKQVRLAALYAVNEW